MPDQATFVTLDNIVNGWRQRVLFFLDTSVWGRLWDIVDFLLNNTTVVDDHGDPSRIPMANRLLEFLITVIFLSQYVLRYVVINANHRSLEHAVVLFAFVAPMTAYFMSIHNHNVRDSYMSAGVMAIFYPARFLRLHYAVDRLVAMAASTRHIHLSLIRQEVVSLCSDIIVAILFFASLVHSGVNWYSQTNHVQYEGFTFLDSIYSIVMSGMGEDGVIPPSTFFQVISMGILALIALAVPSRISRLVDLALNTSSYTKTVALPTATRHALVCGHIEIESVRQFLHEFFNADHGPNIFKTTIVVLHTDEPSMEMKALLRDPAYANRVFYVKGATSLKALKRARVDLATCVYILTRKTSHGSGIDQDAETVLIALALNAFSAPFVTRTTDTSVLQVFAQTILPNSIAHLAYLQTSRIVCIDEMRLGIMAQNCATPGFAALAFMLSTSVANHVNWDYSGVFTEEIASSAATRYFYRCHGLLVFGVGSFSRSHQKRHTAHHPSIADSSHYQVMLAPRNYTLQPQDMLFAIATDVQAVLNAVAYAERVSMSSAKIKYPRHSFLSTRKMASRRPSADSSHSPLRFARGVQPPAVNYISDSSDHEYVPKSHTRESVQPVSPGPRDSYFSPLDPKPVAAQDRQLNCVPNALENHIVVCDSSPEFPRSMPLLIQALKDAFEDDLPIVILSPCSPDPQLEHALLEFPQVYVIRGTPLSQPDLRRTCIENAQKAIVLSSSSYGGSEGETGGDSAAILANMNMQQLCGGEFFVTTELVDIENIRYLDHTQLLGEPLLKRTFMGGHIFMPALIDTALCQCYFSSHILDVLRHLTFSHACSPRVMSTVCTPRADEHAAVVAASPGRLSLVYVPERFAGKRYDTLVLTLMKQHGAVALGLYRVVSHNAQSFATVMCNPLPSAIVAASDAVYVLGPDISGWPHVSERMRPVAAASPGASKAGHDTGSSQSRHTVYSHNTACTPKDEHVTFALDAKV
ncbi:hypothetical protein IW148_004087 [Coemansia sp. RSA 1199]|nr:hypothetical protein IW148_004087 [Coemansia sp. RSA 1199]